MFFLPLHGKNGHDIYVSKKKHMIFFNKNIVGNKIEIIELN